MEQESKGWPNNIPPELATMYGILFNPKYLRPSPVPVNPPRIDSKRQGNLGDLGIIPNELLIDILFQLAFTDLLRLKFASKSLSTLISGAEIAHAHLRTSLESGSNSPFLVFKDIAACYSIDMDKLESRDWASKVIHRRVHGLNIIGSCNGLLCVRDGKNGAILYNPSTRDRHDMPMPQGHFLDYRTRNFGFGYDSTCSDYKVLKMYSFRSNNIILNVMIYSLKMNLWGKVEPLPSYIAELESDNGVLCNETLHWAFKVRGGSDIGIIGFELHHETYHQVPVPNFNDVSKVSGFSVGTLGGSLCASYHQAGSLGGASYYFVWVMKEYGVKDSWTVLLKITGNLQSVTHARPIAYSRSRDEVLVDINGTHFLWFDLRNNVIKGYVNCHHSEAILCLQSVVSPNRMLE